MKNPCEECIVKPICTNDCEDYKKYSSKFDINSIEDLKKHDVRTRIQTFLDWYSKEGILSTIKWKDP